MMLSSFGATLVETYLLAFIAAEVKQLQGRLFNSSIPCLSFQCYSRPVRDMFLWRIWFLVGSIPSTISQISITRSITSPTASNHPSDLIWVPFACRNYDAELRRSCFGQKCLFPSSAARLNSERLFRLLSGMGIGDSTCPVGGVRQ